jgi:hypothetical protein
MTDEPTVESCATWGGDGAVTTKVDEPAVESYAGLDVHEHPLAETARRTTAWTPALNLVRDHRDRPGLGLEHKNKTLVQLNFNALPFGNPRTSVTLVTHATRAAQAPHTAICRRYLQIVYTAVLNLVLFSTI